MVVKCYFSSVTSDVGTKKHQQKIEMILSSKKYEYQTVDIATDLEAKEKMRQMMNNDKGVPPQLFNDDTYLGGFDEFMEAVEDENLQEFLKV